MCSFSNRQELLGIANMLNITIRIFSYGIGGDEAKTEWREVSPDPVMAEAARFLQDGSRTCVFIIVIKVVLTRSKEGGGRRTNPTSQPQMHSFGIAMIKCTWKICKMQLESKGLLTSHRKEHRPIFSFYLFQANSFHVFTQ